jgi:transcriptional regulator with XRE-family HTH domain
MKRKAETVYGIVNKQWFLAAFEAMKISQNQMADKLGIDRSAMSRTLDGKRRAKRAEIVKLAALLGVPEKEVAYNFGELSTTEAEEMVTANITDFATGGSMRVVATKTDIPILVPPTISAKACRVIQVKNPNGFMDGVKLFYYPTKKVAPGAVGDLCVIQRKGEAEFYLRQVSRGSGVGRYDLENKFSPIGERVETDVLLQSAAPIEEYRK